MSDYSDYHPWLRNGIYAAPAIVFGCLLMGSMYTRAKWLRGRWPLRAAVPLAACALLLPTRMYEATLFALAASVLFSSGIAVGWVVGKLWTAWRRRGEAGDGATSNGGRLFRFGLRDILWGTSLCAVALAIGTYCARHSGEFAWRPLLSAALCYALLLLAAAAATVPRYRRNWQLALRLILFFPVAFGLTMWWSQIDWLKMADNYDWSFSFGPSVQPYLSTAFVVFAVGSAGLFVSLIAVRFAIRRPAEGEEQTAQPSWLRVSGRALAAAAFLTIFLPSAAATVWLYVVLCRPLPPTHELSVEGNGYNELTAALDGLGNASGPDVDTVTADELAAFVAANDTHLVAVDAALEKPCSKVLYFGPDAMNLGFRPINAARCVMRAKLSQGKLLEAAGSHAAASQRYMQAVTLGEALRHGGLDIDVLIGMAIEAGGLESLRRQRGKLDAATCRTLIRQLQQIDAQQEPWQRVVERDAAWSIRVGGDAVRLAYAIDDMSGEGVMEMPQSMKNAIARSNAQRRLLIAELAVLAFNLERGRNPASLEELIPDYLRNAPIDPFCGKPLVYRRDGESCVLYSVGIDGVDDGGALVDRMRATISGGGDYFLDAPEPDDDALEPDDEEAAGAVE